MNFIDKYKDLLKQDVVDFLQEKSELIKNNVYIKKKLYNIISVNLKATLALTEFYNKFWDLSEDLENSNPFNVLKKEFVQMFNEKSNFSCSDCSNDDLDFLDPETISSMEQSLDEDNCYVDKFVSVEKLDLSGKVKSNINGKVKIDL